MEELIEQLTEKVNGCGMNTKAERMLRGAYVDALVMAKEALNIHLVGKRNIAIGDYVWYNERINKVTNVRFNDHFWINKEIQLFDIEARLTMNVSTKNLRYVC